MKHFVIKTVTYFTVKLEMYIWTIMHHEFVMKERPHNFTFQKYFGKFLSISKNLWKLFFDKIYKIILCA